MPRALRSVDQLAIDEQAIEDDAILTALESWQNAKVEAAAAAGIVKREKEAAMKLLEDINIDLGMAVRVGPFRISREVVAAKSVSFETAEGETLRVRMVAEE